jgi:hypothetical protein
MMGWMAPLRHLSAKLLSDRLSVSVIYGTVVGGFMFGFVRLVARAFIESGETRPPDIAGTSSSLLAILGAD